MLGEMCRRALAAYPADTRKSHEVDVIRTFIEKLLFTVQLLRIKYVSRSANIGRSLWVDMINSGFPNAQEFYGIADDLRVRDERLKILPARAILVREVLDGLLKEGRERSEVLWQLAERSYLEMLKEDSVLLPFTPGALIRHPKGDTANAREYFFSWGNFDFTTSIPHIHVMVFHQDLTEQPLEDQGPNYLQFIAKVRAEGSRAPEKVAIVLAGIDDALEPIHPKMLKRLAVGPLYSRLLFDEYPVGEEDEETRVIRELMRGAQDPNDFVLFVRDEMIFSRDQQVTRSILAPRGKVREVFAINHRDEECFRRGATVVAHNVLMPHSVLQEVDAAVIKAMPIFGTCRKITYDDRGRVEIHGV